jgi:uncharacterized membrane protein YuzA (DUF378 family)
MRLSTLEWVALILVIIGALNWGLFGLFGYDVVEEIFGSLTTISRLIYIFIGLAGMYLLYWALARSSNRRALG